MRPPIDVTERSPSHPEAAGPRLVEVAPLGVPLGVLTYQVPDDLPEPPPGAHVVVPVGGRRLAGIVVGPAAPLPGRSLKALSAVRDDREPIPPDVLRLARWTASYYLAPLGEVLRLSLPPEVGRTVEARFALTGRGRELVADLALDAPSRAVLDALAGARSLTRRGLARVAGGASGGGDGRRALPEVLRKLERAGAIERLAGERPRRHRPRRSYAPSREVSADDLAALARRSPKLATAWSRVHALGRAEAADLADLGEGVATRLERLVARGWLSRDEYLAGAGDQHVLAPSSSARHALTAEQRAAVDAVAEARARGAEASPIALLGVTGSGKTEVYLAAVEETLASGASALVLVPEIALTPLAVGRFRQRFGERVGVLHSGLGESERAAEWSRAVAGESRVLIGTRLAIFAPIPRLGLIVVDEEHDASYKQDGGVRYHARDIAVVRAQMTGCPVVLGSATPSVETYWNARAGRYRLVELTARPGAAMLPTIEVVDLKSKENHTPGSSRLSAPVVEALARNAERGEQSLLFLNRRGWAPIVVCESCGDRPGCPRCSVSLALHRRPPRLVCHYCGTERDIPERCARCGAADLRRLGAGTQRIEDELAALLPDVTIERLDRDSVSSAGKRTRVLERVAARAVDVLIGTQMVAKGHDFPHVTFSAVLSIDGLLARSDFRAVERAFQLLVQVSGRSGRADRPGRVMLQSFHPGHPVFRFAIAHDVKGFLDAEIEFRRGSGYPPFGRLAAVGVEGPEREGVERDATWIAEELVAEVRHASERIEVLGPAPAVVERIDDRVRRRILLRAEKPRRMQAAITAVLGNPPRLKAPNGSRIAVDVDPLALL